jgi:protein TonB
MENSELVNSSMDDIVFESRNKAYGAYFLRNELRRNFLLAMIGASVFVSLIVFSPAIVTFFSDLFGMDKAVEVEKEVVVDVVVEDIPLDPETPPPPAVKIPPPAVEMIRFLPPEIKPDNEVKKIDIPPTEEELEEVKNIGSIDQKGDTSLNVMIEDGPRGNVVVDDGGDDIVYTAVEEDAEFPGGADALRKFMQKNVIYPRKAEQMEISGRVIVYFEIDKEGKVNNIKLHKGINELLDAEAIRVIKLMPAWKPAKQNGRSVRVRRIFPVVFKLPE